jgi:hypothetical protein
MATRFRADHNFEGQIRRQPSYQAGMHTVAELVVVAADAAAPHVTGYYGRHLEAIGNAAVATDPFGHLVEWGSKNNPPYAPLRRGVLAAGLRLDIAQL